MKKKSIIINGGSHRELKRLSNTYGAPLGALVEAMITYFKKTGINPHDALNQNPSVMIKALDKRIVSFMKVQERDILKPMQDEVYSNSKKQEEKLMLLTENLKGLIGKMNGADENRTQMVKQELIIIKKMVVELARVIDPRDKSGFNNKIQNLFK